MDDDIISNKFETENTAANKHQYHHLELVHEDIDEVIEETNKNIHQTNMHQSQKIVDSYAVKHKTNEIDEEMKYYDSIVECDSNEHFEADHDVPTDNDIKRRDSENSLLNHSKSSNNDLKSKIEDNLAVPSISSLNNKINTKSNESHNELVPYVSKNKMATIELSSKEDQETASNHYHVSPTSSDVTIMANSSKKNEVESLHSLDEDDNYNTYKQQNYETENKKKSSVSNASIKQFVFEEKNNNQEPNDIDDVEEIIENEEMIVPPFDIPLSTNRSSEKLIVPSSPMHKKLGSDLSIKNNSYTKNFSNKDLKEGIEIDTVSKHSEDSNVKHKVKFNLNESEPIDKNQSVQSIKNSTLDAYLPDDDDKNSVRYKSPTEQPNIFGLPSSYGKLGWLEKKEIVPVDYKENYYDIPLPLIEEENIVTESDAKAALENYVNEKFCYDKKCAKEAVITKLTPINILKYSLESFTEKRFISYLFEPYNGEAIDESNDGQIIDIWNIPYLPDTLFTSFSHTLRIPKSEKLMDCFRCNSQGRLTCSGCDAKGKKACYVCNQSGKVEKDLNLQICEQCKGKGFQNCIRCNGTGLKVCNICNESGKLKCFLELEIQFINHINEFQLNKTNLPQDLLEHTTVDIILSQTYPKLLPITQFDSPEIVEQSKSFFSQHEKFSKNEMLIAQRQTLTALNVTECEYTWNDIDSKFIIYGNENRVYHPDYPQKSCCCSKCNIS